VEVYIHIITIYINTHTAFIYCYMCTSLYVYIAICIHAGRLQLTWTSCARGTRKQNSGSSAGTRIRDEDTTRIGIIWAYV